MKKDGLPPGAYQQQSSKQSRDDQCRPVGGLPLETNFSFLSRLIEACHHPFEDRIAHPVDRVLQVGLKGREIRKKRAHETDIVQLTVPIEDGYQEPDLLFSGISRGPPLIMADPLQLAFDDRLSQFRFRRKIVVDRRIAYLHCSGNVCIAEGIEALLPDQASRQTTDLLAGPFPILFALAPGILHPRWSHISLFGAKILTY